MISNITAKCLHLFSIWTGTDRLRLFQADLREEGSFNEAVKGCDGVFHVAASMEFNVAVEDNVGNAYLKKKKKIQYNFSIILEGNFNLTHGCFSFLVFKKVMSKRISSTLLSKEHWTFSNRARNGDQWKGLFSLPQSVLSLP